MGTVNMSNMDIDVANLGSAIIWIQSLGSLYESCKLLSFDIAPEQWHDFEFRDLICDIAKHVNYCEYVKSIDNGCIPKTWDEWNKAVEKGSLPL